CAAHPGGKSLIEPVLDVEVNALGSMRLFYWCARNKVEIIYLSSSAVYGAGHHSAIKETDLPNPGTIYAVCKVACENYLRILGQSHGLKWTVLRLFATYGNGHKASTFQGIVNVLLTQLLTGETVVVKGSLERVRGLVYVKDAARAIVLALLNSESRGEIINVSHPEPATVGQILYQLIDILKKTGVKTVISEGTIGDPFANFADCSKAQRLLKFNPNYSLRLGLAELVKDRQKR
ncbi:NAD-dependent epimerase/dehydratase family protein, partial [bacterium]|nr:NAD-dependent epimerase/dehydratase family protein [bacterium]